MNRILTALSLLFLTVLQGNAQETSIKKTASEKYIKETVQFLTTVKKKELSDSTFTLVDFPKYACFLYTIDDSVSFTNEELAQIASEIEVPRITSWKAVLPAKIRFLNERFVASHSKVIKNPKREAKFFKKKFGGCYHHFSAPIFLRDYTFCLLYTDSICAAGKSKGELQVFEKRDGVWLQLTSRCEWTE